MVRFVRASVSYTHLIENGECPLDALPELKPVMEAVNKAYPEAGKGDVYKRQLYK